MLDEYTSWVDPRLAYANNPNISSFYKGNNRLEITDNRFSVWRPMIGYTEMNKLVNTSETMFLYPNGTISYFRIIALTITCQFEYLNIPSDSHSCSTVAYINNEFTDTSKLFWVDRYPSRTVKHLTWTFNINYDKNVDVRWRTKGDGVHSGVRVTFEFERDPAFF